MRISDQESNRLRIVKAIRRAEPVSRTELAALTGLAGGTITEITGELLRRKILLEERAPGGGVGRPRMALRLNPDAAYVVSAILAGDGALAVDVTNARGDVLFGSAVPVTRAPTLDDLVDQVAGAIETTIAASPLDKAAIHSVGLALPGIIEGRSGVLHFLTSYASSPYPFGPRVQERLGLPVFMDSATNVAARGEHWFGDDRALDDFTYILFDAWIGLAQYADGLLWDGMQGVNPEFGHVKVGPREGRRCICGGEDCLGVHASLYAIARQEGLSIDETAPDLDEITAACEDLAARARAGDARSVSILRHAAEAFGAAVGSYINVANPTRILISTIAPTVTEVMKPMFDEALRAATLPVLYERCAVQWRVRPQMAHRQGAAALVLEQLHRVPTAAQLSAAEEETERQPPRSRSPQLRPRPTRSVRKPPRASG